MIHGVILSRGSARVGQDAGAETDSAPVLTGTEVGRDG